MTIDHRIMASLLAGNVSWSRARRRECISHANERSATRRLGSTTNPFMSSVRLTT
ncbi:hypothetical protein OG410_40775 [Streptomyces sp. NBC_00659]